MHILRLTIENIRSIRQFELDLSRENPEMDPEQLATAGR